MLLTFLTENQAEIVTALTARIRQLASAYRSMPEHELSTSVQKGMEAGLAILRHNDMRVLDRFLATTVAARLPDNFPLSLLYSAFTAFGALLPSILQECHSDNAAHIAVDLQRLHMLKDTMLSRLVQHYEEQAQQLVREQQEQLQAYSAQLEQQLVQVGDEFQTLQEFNECIIQSMTSGLMVADKETRRILKVNEALEHQANISADEVVGKTVDEVFGKLRGLPLQEISDEVERHGTIARRTHRLYTDSGREFYRSITGQVFYNHKGEYKGVIVITDDISAAELLRDTFSRYLSPQVLKQVLAEEQRPSLQSVRRDVTVLFTDLRNFTSFAELYEPEEVVEVLNQYLDVMVEVLFEHEGTLDKFAGDGLLALFGTPLSQPDHHCRAVQAALDMQRAIAELNARRRARHEPVLDVGIGINSGETIVGNIGSEKRMEFTVIGDMVNIAHRLQARARGGDIIIGAQTLAHVQHLVTVYETTEEPVRGRQRPVRAHRIGPRTA